MIVESKLYKKEEKWVTCLTCMHRCRIKDGEWGRCRVRKNEDGILRVYNYGQTSAIALDPIEKKPLHNFKPASKVLSFGSVSCNFRCPHCQNYEIAFSDLTYPYLRELSPEDVLEMALTRKADGIAWTYNEPAIWHEFALDSSELVKREGLFVVYVSNGYMSRESIDQFEGILDAVNVDVKAFNENFYKKLCKARFERVLECVAYLVEKKIFVELTYLIIPGENDNEDELKRFSEWVYELDAGIPVHFSRFHPDFQILDKPATSIQTLERAYRIAKDAGLEYVYLGNVWGHKYESTYCPRCGYPVIQRQGFYIEKIDLDDSKCPKCGYEQNIIV
ncbi:Pyruvate-formate lyase-activating enzyme [Archaeoglobus sulfaticallidus PM70-1]|uniref:Pyruvate-formate lyase-activating enzyme n=1 Tax=Archaeoglobus sulfaticallidus PM70-1 TaxID=387631 RepID=N0BAI5_9EURY|nr:AmmeMemoRadiSam system radical SAM enzyme [Archaeoglobus sulfaticallidus]AGK60619.1 Pyruvate-formate lyase-activating enzyme [Archaeoglobus sulfaticallidus PM70-1]